MTNHSTIAPGVYRFTVDESSGDKRLDQFLGSCPGGLTRGLARKLVDIGGVHLDGRRMRRCSQIVKAGQKVEVFVDAQPLEAFDLGPEHILLHDDFLLALNKPVGVATQPTPARFKGTLYAAVQSYLDGQRKRGGKKGLGMAQRLDRDTSGVIVFSIHPKAHKGLTQAFSDHQVKKVYWTLVSGEMEEPEGEIRSLLAKRRSTNRMVSVEKGGKPAVTRYRVLACHAGISLLEVEILTGRMHQIRVHFSEQGHPLLGDRFYGGPGKHDDIDLPRQMLHARSLTMNHPVNGTPLTLQAPLADDFAAVMERLGFARQDL